MDREIEREWESVMERENEKERGRGIMRKSEGKGEWERGRERENEKERGRERMRKSEGKGEWERARKRENEKERGRGRMRKSEGEGEICVRLIMCGVHWCCWIKQTLARYRNQNIRYTMKAILKQTRIALWLLVIDMRVHILVR